MARESPRWALVVGEADRYPRCVPMDRIDAEQAGGALVIAREDAELCTREDLADLQSNPRRLRHRYRDDADWR